MPRGKYVNHKGRHRHFSMPEEMEKQMNETEESSEEESGSESDDENEAVAGGSRTRNSGGVKNKKSPTLKKSSLQKGQGSDDSDEDDDDENDGAEGRDSGVKKGVAGLIKINNPNRQIKKLANKVEGVSLESKAELSSSDRKQLEKQRAQREYQKLHAEGKTFQAKADLARLALIRQQREEAAAKREAEKKQLEESKKPPVSNVHVKSSAISNTTNPSKGKSSASSK